MTNKHADTLFEAAHSLYWEMRHAGDEHEDWHMVDRLMEIFCDLQDLAEDMGFAIEPYNELLKGGRNANDVAPKA